MHEHHCAHCGYDLVGLPIAGSCPECGRPFDKASRRGVAGPRADAVDGDKVKRWVGWGFVALAGLTAATGCGLALTSADPLRPLAAGLTVAAVFLVIGLFPLSR